MWSTKIHWSFTSMSDESEIDSPVENKNRFKNILLISLAFIVALFCLVYLFSDFLIFDKNNDGNRQSLAILNDKKNTVRQKKEGSEAWINLDLNDQLYLNDTIFTQEDSTGAIKFNDGTILEMAPKTLLKLDGNIGDTQINLISGFMLAKMSDKTKSDQKLRLKAGNTSLELDSSNANLQLQADENGENKVTILSGQADILVNGQKIQVGENQYLQISKDGNSQIKNLEIQLLSPEMKSEYIGRADNLLVFNWKTGRQVDKFELTIADDPLFKINKKSFSSAEKTFTLPKINDGNHYWKVTAQTSDNDQFIESQILNFTSFYDRAPKLVSPLPNQVLNVSTIDGQGDFNLEWEEIWSKQYEYELVKDEKSLASKQTEKNIANIKIKNIKSGEYQWRVRAIDPKRPDSPWSITSIFKINLLKNQLAPAELFPEDGDVIQIGKNLIRPIEFSWVGDTESNHVLQVALDSSFEQIVFTKSDKGNAFEWNTRVFGEFYWRVGLSSTDITKTSWSKTHRFQLIAAGPELTYPPTEETVVLYAPGSVEFDWEDVFFEELNESTSNSFYTIEASDSDKFESFFFKEKTLTSFFEWSEPKFGSVYWRTKANPQNSIGNWSSTFRFTLEKSMPPKPPQLLPKIQLKLLRGPQTFFQSPLLKKSIHQASRSPAQISNPQEQTFVEIVWPKSDRIKNYRIQIFYDAQLSLLAIDQSIEQPPFRWNNPKPGAYFYRIAAIDFWDQQGDFSLPSELTVVGLVSKSLVKDRPRLIYPLTAEIIDVKNLNNQMLNFNWEFPSSALEYRLILSKSKSFNSIIFNQNTDNKNLLLDLKSNPLDGQYYWRVQARLPGDREVMSPIRQLTILNDQLLEDELLESFTQEENKTRKQVEKINPKENFLRKSTTHLLQFSYLPSTLYYNVDSNPDAIDGKTNEKVLTSFEILGQWSWNDTFKNEIIYNQIQGNALNQNEKFSLQNIKLDFVYRFHINNLNLIGPLTGLGVQQTTVSEFSLSDSLTINNNSNTYLVPYIKLGVDFIYNSSLVHVFFAQLGFGDVSFREFSYSLNYHPMNQSKIFYTLGLRAKQFIYEVGTQSIEIASNQLQAGIGLAF